MRRSQTEGPERAVGPPRLFAAVPLPESLREGLFSASEELGHVFAAGLFRRVPLENLHLTLRFFGPEKGPVDRERIAALLRECLETPRFEPPILRLSHFSAFSSLRRARVVWAGFSEEGVREGGSGRLGSLQEAVEGIARELGLPPEGRRFTPHVTIGRLRSPTAISEGALAALSHSCPAAVSTLTVRACALFASYLRPGGARYRRLDSFPLSGR